MNSQPSRSCRPRTFSRKSYIPNLSASCRRKVKTKETENAEKTVESSSGVKLKYSRGKKFIRGTETFAALPNTSNSDVENEPKITEASNNHLDDAKAVVACSDGSSSEDFRVAKSLSSEYPSDSPISVPRTRLSFRNDTIDFSDLIRGESIFVLKIPKYLPGMLDGLVKSEASSSKSVAQKCTMGNLPEGQIGTLQITKSNRLRLVLGECAFWLHRGVSVPYKEELAFVNADPATKAGEIINLGDIKDRIIAVPESVTTFASPESVP